VLDSISKGNAQLSEVRPNLSQQARLARASQLAVQHVRDDIYKVRSSDGTKTYVVDIGLGVCSCPDFYYRGIKCKHLISCEIKRDVKLVTHDYTRIF